MQMSPDIMCTVINIKVEGEHVLPNTNLETPCTLLSVRVSELDALS